MNKNKAAPKTAKDPNALNLKDDNGKPREEQMAGLVTGGVLNSTALIAAYSKDLFGEIDITACHQAMLNRAKDIKGGNLDYAETLLISQAAALDAIFGTCAGRAKINMGQYPQAADSYMRMALRAQSQCRATLETLALVKNPQPYVRQQNIAAQQIVNNGKSSARGENSKSANELIKDKRGEYETLDTGGTAETGRTDKELEAVGTIDRSKDARG